MKNVFTNTYIRDVIERNSIVKESAILDDLLDIISSSIGSLSNPTKLANIFLSERGIKISQFTVNSYLEYFIDAFLNNPEKYIKMGLKKRKEEEDELQIVRADNFFSENDKK